MQKKEGERKVSFSSLSSKFILSMDLSLLAPLPFSLLFYWILPLNIK